MLSSAFFKPNKPFRLWDLLEEVGNVMEEDLFYVTSVLPNILLCFFSSLYRMILLLYAQKSFKYPSVFLSLYLDFLLLKLPGHLHVLQFLLMEIQVCQPSGGFAQFCLSTWYYCSTPFVHDVTYGCHRITLTINYGCNLFYNDMLI